MKQTPFIEIDVHGLYADEAIAKIEQVVAAANESTYRIRVIHGYHRGNSIQQSIYRELDKGRNPKIKRITGGDNPGITELILKEF